MKLNPLSWLSNNKSDFDFIDRKQDTHVTVQAGAVYIAQQVNNHSHPCDHPGCPKNHEPEPIRVPNHRDPDR